MSYLIFADFKKTIQSDNLMQIIGSDLSILNGIALTAQAQAVSYLTQQFHTSQEFTDTGIYDIKAIYKPGSRVYLDAIPYSTSQTFQLKQTFQLNDLTLQSGQVYYCTTAIPTPQAFTASNWTLLGLQHDLYFGAYPHPKFDLYKIYTAGESVYYNGNSYVCLLPTVMYNHEWQLQSNSQQSFQNFFPTDPSKGSLYWQYIITNTIPAGSSITNPNFWTPGDNRSSELVMYCCDMALYHIHSRIAPRNIPDLRVKRFDEAIKWFKMASRGEVTADLPSIQPLQGGRIRYSTQTKQINNY